MSLPVGNTAIVTRDDKLLSSLQEQTHQMAHRQSAPAKAALKTQAEALIKKCPLLNDKVKDISKQNVNSSIDTCVDFSTKEVIGAVFNYLKPSGS